MAIAAAPLAGAAIAAGPIGWFALGLVALVAVVIIAEEIDNSPPYSPSGNFTLNNSAVDIATDDVWQSLIDSENAAMADALYFASEHTKGKRKSTKGKHEKGRARNQRDHGGEKGDARRKPNPNKRR